MIDAAITVVSWVLIGAGSIFVIVGGVGLLRMPDVFTRMHAASITDTLGAGMILVGMMLAGGFSLVSAKLLIILLVILFTSPVATHALAQAALHAGINPVLADLPARAAKRSSVASTTKPAKTKTKKSPRKKAAKGGGRRPSKR